MHVLFTAKKAVQNVCNSNAQYLLMYVTLYGMYCIAAMYSTSFVIYNFKISLNTGDDELCVIYIRQLNDVGLLLLS